jgi:hypothetical protein
MTYEKFVYVMYQDNGNWSIDQITATVRLSTVREWIRITFEDVFDDARIDFWAEEVRKMPLRGEITISDENDYLHIRKVNPERD